MSLAPFYLLTDWQAYYLFVFHECTAKFWQVCVECFTLVFFSNVVARLGKQLGWVAVGFYFTFFKFVYLLKNFCKANLEDIHSKTFPVCRLLPGLSSFVLEILPSIHHPDTVWSQEAEAVSYLCKYTIYSSIKYFFHWIIYSDLTFVGKISQNNWINYKLLNVCSLLLQTPQSLSSPHTGQRRLHICYTCVVIYWKYFSIYSWIKTWISFKVPHLKKKTCWAKKIKIRLKRVKSTWIEHLKSLVQQCLFPGEGNWFLQHIDPESASGFPCINCGKIYKHRGNMRRHMVYECGKQARFQCSFCDRKFHQQSNLKRHFENKHTMLPKFSKSITVYRTRTITWYQRGPNYWDFLINQSVERTKI